jgi:hypothetical protein
MTDQNRRGAWRTGPVALVCLLCAAAARPVLAAPEPLRTLSLPGTPLSFAGALGLDASAIERPRYMLELVRHVWGLNGGVVNQAALDRLVVEVKGLQRLQKAWFAARSRDNAVGLEDAKSSGKVRSFLELLGLQLVENGRERRVEVIVDGSADGTRARDAVAAAGFDSASIAAALTRGQRLKFTLPTFDVPLPLQPAVWTGQILRMEVSTEWLFAAILAHREASLLYHGLLALDPETLAFVASQPKLAEHLATDHAGVVATCGRSLHVRGGKVVVPGGDAPEVVRLWERAVGRKVTEPLQFIDQLLGRRDGKLAYLYDVVQHLDARHQRFALGGRALGAAPDAAFTEFERLFDVVQQPDLMLDLLARPFMRPSVDVFVALSSIEVTAEGDLQPPFDAVMWSQLLSGGEQGRPLSAAAVARLIVVPDPGGRLPRLRLFLFAQRVFGGAKPEELPQILQALKPYDTYQLLYGVLERMGVRKPSTYSAAALWAGRLSATRDPDIAVQSLSEFQSAIALMDRCVFTGRLAPATATWLVDRLVELPVDADGSYAGGVARWLKTQLLPALDPRAVAGAGKAGGREQALLAALAGVRAGDGAAPVFTWKDVEYRFDPGETDLKRLEAVRQKQAGNSLDSVLDLDDVVTELRLPARTLASGRQAMTAALSILEKLREPPPGRRTPGVKATLALVTQRLPVIQAGADVKRLDEVADAVGKLAEFLLSTTLRSMAYAVPIIPDGPALTQGDPSALHDFGARQPAAELRQSVPWILATGFGDPWHANGSVLALDLALWDLAFRATSNEPPSGRLMLTDDDRLGIAESTQLFNPYQVTDDDTRWIAASIDRGRRRVNDALGDGAALRALAVEAGLGEWATETLPWAVESDREAARGAFTLRDLLRLGASDPSAAASRPAGIGDRWGSNGRSLTGCLRLHEPPSTAWESFALRPSGGYVVLFTGDMPLHVASWLAQMKLPAALARAILPAAMQDLRDGVHMAHFNDWRAVARYAVEYPESRFADVVTSLADHGGLPPAGRR